MRKNLKNIKVEKKKGAFAQGLPSHKKLKGQIWQIQSKKVKHF